jgi:hypothetical protein
MKVFGILVITLVASVPMLAQDPSPKLEQPELHRIKAVTLSPSYSCRPAEEFQLGYQDTALFLSAYSRGYNAPDLLFKGGCRGEDYFDAALAGDDMSLIADLGDSVSLEDVSAIKAFNLQRVHSGPAYSRFVRSAKVEPNHTYAVLLNGRDRRGLIIVTVVSHLKNQRVDLRYAVKSYQVMPSQASPGFDWEKPSH